MAPDEPDDNVPEGAALFPEIPEELGVHPLLLGALHATVFLIGSNEDIVNAEAADEVTHQITVYLQRLRGNDLRRVQEDMNCLTAFARQEKWPKQLIQFLKSFLADLQIGAEGEE